MSQSGIAKDSASGATAIETITGNSGGAVSPDAGFNINLLGAGSVTVTGSPGTHTLTISVSGSGLSWNNVTGASLTMASNNGYYANNAGAVTLTLPTTPTFGDYIAIIGTGAGGWVIAQNAGQSVRIGANASTVGVGGSVTSANRYDSIELICGPDNATWSSLGGPESAGLIIV